MYYISKFIFWLLGWKIKGEVPPLKKFVVIAAPHTSAWDVVFGLGAIYLFRLKLSFFVKKEAFNSPLGFLFRAVGGVPVDRSSKHNLVEQATKMFEEKDEFILALAPEGTREYVAKWKTGFYYIAVAAKVPILCSYFDFENKIVGIGPTIYPTGNLEKDMELILNFYRPIKGKHPEKGVR
jgi:1-acyl-sn-glycerol-3-phosphate acyltransferase